MSMSSAGRAASSSGCVGRPRALEIGLSGFAVQIRPSSLTGSYAMATAEHREPYESRGSRTVLGAPGGESPPGDSTNCEVGRFHMQVSTGSESGPSPALTERRGATRSSASGKLEHGIRGRTRRPDTARASAAAVGHECDRHPRRVEHEPGQQHELSRHWADRRPRKELVERRDRCRMDQKLANIGRYLNEKDPTVVVPQPPTNGLEKGDVETWGNVVLVKGRVPAVVDANALPAEDRSEKMDFQDMRPDAEEIEEAVPQALNKEKYGDQQADQHQRQRRGCFAAEGQRERQSGGRDCPVGCCVKPRPPHRAAVHLASIEMR